MKILTKGIIIGLIFGTGVYLFSKELAYFGFILLSSSFIWGFFEAVKLGRGGEII